MIKVLEKPKGWHQMWVPVLMAPAPQPAAAPPVLMLPKPMTYEEEVYITCAQANVRWDQAWIKCLESSELARICNQVSLSCTKRAVRHADAARQHLTLALLAGTAPYDCIPAVAGN